MPAQQKNSEKIHSGYHVFFSEERARLLKSKGSCTKKNMSTIAKKWRSLDTLTRVEYEVRSQEQNKRKAQGTTSDESIIASPSCEENLCQEQEHGPQQKKQKVSPLSPLDKTSTKIFRHEPSRNVKKVVLDDVKMSDKPSLTEEEENSASEVDFFDLQLSMIITIGELQTFQDHDLVDFMCDTFA